MAAPWTPDSDVAQASEKVANKLLELALTKRPLDADGAVQWYADNLPALMSAGDPFTSLRQEELAATYDRLSMVSERLDDRSQVIGECLSAVRHCLGHWEGQAADAFRGQMDSIEAFCRQHAAFVVNELGTVGAALALAKHVRDDYIELAEATIKTIDREIEQSNQKAIEYVVKVGAGIAKTVIAAVSAPGAVIPAVGQGIIDFGVESTSYSLGLSSFEDFPKAFLEAVRKLQANYEGELEYVTHTLREARRRLDAALVDIAQPLASCTDVDSPDFRYESFYTMSRLPHGNYDDKVERERREHATRTKNGSSRSRYRLDGGNT